MANQSDYMKNRLHEFHQGQVTKARRALYFLAAYSAFAGLMLLITNHSQFRGFGNLLFVALYFVIAQASHKNPVLHFRIGFWVSLVMALLSLLSFQLLATVILGVVAYFLYEGIDGAKYFAEQAPAVVEDENILDANLWEDEEK